MFYIFGILLLLASLGQVSSDIYLPSLPAIAHSLSASDNAVQFSVSLFMYGFALSPLLYGPISDAIGRRKPLIVGVSILLFGSIVCLLATSVNMLIFGRFLQGLGAGSGVALSRSILRDSYAKTGEQLAKVSSYLIVGNISIMASAPLVGSYIQKYFNWRGNFVFLVIYALIALLVTIFILPETNKHQHTDHLKPRVLLQNVKTLITHREFVGYSLVMFLTYGGILAWLTVAPILLQKQLHLTPVEFGWTAFSTGMAYAAGGLLNARYVMRVGIDTMLKVGGSIMLLGGILMFVFAIFGYMNFWTVLIPTMIFIFATSMVFANTFARALQPFPKIAGIAASIFVMMQILGGAVISSVLAGLQSENVIPLSITFTLLGLLVLMILLWLIKASQ